MDKMLSKMDPSKLQREFAEHIHMGAPIPSLARHRIEGARR